MLSRYAWMRANCQNYIWLEINAAEQQQLRSTVLVDLARWVVALFPSPGPCVSYSVV